MTEVTIQQLMDSLPMFFVPERAAGVDRTVQFRLNGEKGGDWIVHIFDQQIDVRRGVGEHADLTFSAAAQDVLDIFTGQLDPMKAYMRGRLKLDGSMSLAMKLTRYFDVDLNRLQSLGQ